MEFNFSLSQKVWRKKSHTRTGVMQTHTHTLTFQTEHGSSLISPFIHEKRTPVSFSALPLQTFSIFLFLTLLSSLPLSLFPLQCSVEVFTHRRTDPDTHTPLSRYLSSHLPPSLSLSPPSHTRSEWQPASFHTAGNCSATPRHSASPLALSVHLWMSLHHADNHPLITPPHQC